MKTLIICLVILSFTSCKDGTSSSTTINSINEQKNEATTDLKDSQFIADNDLRMYQEKTKSIKINNLIKNYDYRSILQDLVITKKLHIEKGYYTLDYLYPYLNKDIDAGYVIFNTYISDTYLDIEATENEILEDKFIYCDSLQTGRCMDKRIMDYKVYNSKDNLLSIVLYKENYYSGMKHGTFMFECLNYEMDRHQFIYYNDFFDEGSEDKLRTIINSQISELIESGEMYYDCWELSVSDFREYKNNFVITDDTITYYFDDCIVCPSYTGTYSVEIPLVKVKQLLKDYTHTSALDL